MSRILSFALMLLTHLAAVTAHSASEDEAKIREWFKKAEKVPVDATLSGFDLRLGYDAFREKYKKQILGECGDKKIVDPTGTATLTGKTCLLLEEEDYVGKAFFYDGKLIRFTRKLADKRITLRKALDLIKNKSPFPVKLVQRTGDMLNRDSAFGYEGEDEEKARYKAPGVDYAFTIGGCMANKFLAFEPLGQSGDTPDAIEGMIVMGEPISPEGVPCSEKTLDDQIAVKITYVNLKNEAAIWEAVRKKKDEIDSKNGLKL